MDPHYLQSVNDHLRGRGIQCAPGLTRQQLEAAEATHGFQFPPDLRVFLESMLPIGEGFPDWRDPESPFIRERLEWPAEGICFDVERNQFWLEEWGPQPGTLELAQTKAREAVQAAPFLIPIYGHRYIPASPNESGNPVFSVHQTDIIYYGFDLFSYFSAEFGVPNPHLVPSKPRMITFWGHLVS